MSRKVRFKSSWALFVLIGLASLSLGLTPPVSPDKNITATKPPVTNSNVNINSLSSSTLANPEKQPGRRLWNLKDVDIRTFIHAVSEETGRNFVVDPRVTGKVTFISAQPLTIAELYQAFLSVLQVNGFVALPGDKIVKIVPDYVARGLSSPIYNESMHKDGDAMAVSVVPVKYVPANELAAALNQFLTPSGHLAAYAPSNDLIIADRAGNIVHLMRLIREIDQQRASKIEVIRLHNAQAKNLVETLKSILGQRSAAPGTGGTTGGAPSALELGLAPDERTNSILINGGSSEQRSQIRSVIHKLDASSNMPGSWTEVIYLKHLHAEQAATIVNALVQNFLEKMKGANATSPTSPSSSSSGSSTSEGSNAPISSLFNTTMGSSSNSSNSNPSYGGSPSPTGTNNDISNIVGKTPRSGSVSNYVQWEESTNSLVITAPRDLMRKIKVVIGRLDIRRPQVLIEAVIAEVSEQRQKELGVQWNTSGSVSLQTSFLPSLPLSFIGADGKLASLAGGPDTAGQGLSLTKIGNGNQVRLLITALQTDSDSNVLATPNLLTLDNEPAQIKIGSKVPFSTGQVINSTSGNPTNFFEREDVGLVLTIAPHITPNGTIKLLIQQELSAIIPGTAAANSGNPTTSERFIRTTVMADNGRILVLGGLLQNQWSQATNKVPFLGSIPGMGILFRDRNKEIIKTNLMIFLRPTILYDENDESRVSDGKYEFLRQTQLQVDDNNPYRHHFVTPVLPVEGKEVDLPPPFPMIAAGAPIDVK